MFLKRFSSLLGLIQKLVSGSSDCPRAQVGSSPRGRFYSQKRIRSCQIAQNWSMVRIRAFPSGRSSIFNTESFFSTPILCENGSEPLEETNKS